MTNVRYTISIPPKDSELVQFIREKTQHVSMSAYIRELIRNDMENRENQELEQIYLYVEKRLRESGFTLKATANGEVTKIIDEMDKEVILDLF